MRLWDRSLLQGLPRPFEFAAADLLLKDADVFDGARVLPKTSVLVVDGMIRAVGPSLEHEGATVIDCQGKTLMPGMFSCHFHASYADYAPEIFPLGIDKPPGYLAAFFTGSCWQRAGHL